MSKLETQRALPRRRLFKGAEKIIRDRLDAEFVRIDKPKRKAKKAKRK